MIRSSIVNLLCFAVFLDVLHCQSVLWKPLDSLMVSSDVLAIDHLNQNYFINSTNRHLIKLNEDLTINQELASPFLSEYVQLDVSDPMKILLYYPEYSSVQLLDESLGLISDDYYSEFNTESSIAYFSSVQYCIFSGNKLHLKNIIDLKSLSSNPIYYSKPDKNKLNQLKSNGNQIYLHIPGVGVWIFNASLNELTSFRDDQIKQIEIWNNKLLLLKSNVIYLWNQDIKIMEPWFEHYDNISGFACNKRYLLITTGEKILRFLYSKN